MFAGASLRRYVKNNARLGTRPWTRRESSTRNLCHLFIQSGVSTLTISAWNRKWPAIPFPSTPYGTNRDLRFFSTMLWAKCFSNVFLSVLRAKVPLFIQEQPELFLGKENDPIFLKKLGYTKIFSYWRWLIDSTVLWSTEGAAMFICVCKKQILC